ncbi:MAG: hypothetical protein BWY64_01368 [bacterium ADurb.Bin363]|nr:MAG: hypothetical protein BWY64_01368 [bacterium ADurb.Bin363]
MKILSHKQIPFDDNDDFVVRKTPPLELELEEGKINLSNEDYKGKSNGRDYCYRLCGRYD